MKITIIALVLAICLIQSTDAWWGGLYGLGYGWGGLYGGYGGYGGWGGYGMWGKRASTEDLPSDVSLPQMELMNKTECVFTKESSMLSCKGTTGIVECESSWKSDGAIEYTLFALGECEEINPIADHYRVLPRKADNTAWLLDSNTGIDMKLALYYSDKLESDHEGLKVLDRECFGKMKTLLDASARREKVFLEGGIMTAVILSDLTIAAKLPEVRTDGKTTKRWWGYGGYGGLWSGLYGGLYGGGYGGYWGMPSYYYGKRSDSPAIEIKSSKIGTFVTLK